MTDKLIKAIRAIPKLDIWQCEIFPSGVQVVFTLPQRQFVQVAGLKDADWRVRKIIKVCQAQKITTDLRVAAKLKNGATVLNILFSHEAVMNYNDEQELSEIAIDYSKASRFV